MTDTSKWQLCARIVRDIALALYGMAGACALWLAGMLLWQAETGAGRGFALMGICAIPFPVVLWLCLKYRPFRRIHYAALGATAGVPLVLYVVLLVCAPNGSATPGSGVASVFLGDGRYARYAPTNLVPEIDQIKMGIVLSPYYDRFMNDAKRERLLSVTMPMYREMRRRPDYEALGSAMNYSYAQLYGGRFDVGHLYQFVPPHQAGERLPLLIFLHGAAGNFKAYLWVWEQFAQQHRCVIVCPSFGFGTWGRGGVEAVERARAYAVERLPVDAKNVFLAGLSNGGFGVSRVAAAHPEEYRGLVFLSPALDVRALRTESFRKGWQGRPILCITGEDDERMPRSFVVEHMQSLSSGGANVTLAVLPGQDHFLFFAAREEIYARVGAWLEAAGLAFK